MVSIYNNGVEFNLRMPYSNLWLCQINSTSRAPPNHGSSWSGPLACPAGRNIVNMEGLQHTRVSTATAACRVKNKQLVLLINVTLLYPVNYILSGTNIQ